MLLACANLCAQPLKFLVEFMPYAAPEPLRNERPAHPHRRCQRARRRDSRDPVHGQIIANGRPKLLAGEPSALHGGYGSLDDLRASGDLSMARNDRGFYKYSTEITDSGFRVTAIYSGPENPLAPKSLSIDQSMSIIQE